MGIASGIRRLLGVDGAVARAAAGRVLDVPSGYNVRELGGYDTAAGTTRTHRYLRSGGTDRLVKGDIAYLLGYGVTHVLDLRGDFEAPARTCRFARTDGVTWRNVSLYDHDISDPALTAALGTGERNNYLVESYFTMLANRSAVRRIFRFFAEANAAGATCTLFHCAAGMDRTGMCALLLLGLVGASRATIVADYAYSFGSVAEVDAVVGAYLADGVDALESVRSELAVRVSAADAVYDALTGAYGTVRDYLLACDLTADELDTVAASLAGADG